MKGLTFQPQFQTDVATFQGRMRYGLPSTEPSPVSVPPPPPTPANDVVALSDLGLYNRYDSQLKRLEGRSQKLSPEQLGQFSSQVYTRRQQSTEPMSNSMGWAQELAGFARTRIDAGQADSEEWQAVERDSQALQSTELEVMRRLRSRGVDLKEVVQSQPNFGSVFEKELTRPFTESNPYRENSDTQLRDSYRVALGRLPVYTEKLPPERRGDFEGVVKVLGQQNPTWSSAGCRARALELLAGELVEAREGNPIVWMTAAQESGALAQMDREVGRRLGLAGQDVNRLAREGSDFLAAFTPATVQAQPAPEVEPQAPIEEPKPAAPAVPPWVKFAAEQAQQPPVVEEPSAAEPQAPPSQQVPPPPFGGFESPWSQPVPPPQFGGFESPWTTQAPPSQPVPPWQNGGPQAPWNQPASPWQSGGPQAPWNQPASPWQNGGPQAPWNQPASPWQNGGPQAPWNQPASPWQNGGPQAPWNQPVPPWQSGGPQAPWWNQPASPWQNGPSFAPPMGYPGNWQQAYRNLQMMRWMSSWMMCSQAMAFPLFW